jgi:membrane associated rhomboid family serine protease
VNWLPISFYTIPVVRALLIALVGIFLVYFLVYPLRALLPYWLIYTVTPGMLDWLVRPWSWLTYPLLEVSPIGILFQGYALYLAGGTLERSWGSRNFLALFVVFNLITALALVPAAYLFNVNFVLAGMWMPIASLFVAWAAMDPELEFRIYGVFPLKLKFLALIDVGIVYFSYGLSNGPWGPVIGLFALAGPAAAFLYVRKLPRLNLGFDLPAQLPAPGLQEDPPRRRPNGGEREGVGGFNPLRKRQEQREIERLKKLLGEDDDDRPVRR